jgi:hypothetical protein
MRNKVRVMFKSGHEVLIDQEVARELRTAITKNNETEFFWYARADGNIMFAAHLFEIEYLIDMNYR